MTTSLEDALAWFRAIPPLIRNSAATLICVGLVDDDLTAMVGDDVHNTGLMFQNTVISVLRQTGDPRRDAVRTLRFRSAVDLVLADHFSSEWQRERRAWFEKTRPTQKEIEEYNLRADPTDDILQNWDLQAAMWVRAGEQWADLRKGTLSDAAITQALFPLPRNLP